MKEYQYKYLITSERAYRRSDEVDNVYHTNTLYEIGDSFILDGILWTVTEILK